MNNNRIIILGTAHGANVKGKCSPDGKFHEFRFSREIISLIKSKLEILGYSVFVDITDDIVPLPQAKELSQRVSIVNSICRKYGTNNCIYVSVHVNAAGADNKWHTASGFSVYVAPNASENSKKLARIFTITALNNDLCGNRSIPLSKYWTSNLYVLKNTYCPAILTENFFQDNKDDVAYLSSERGKKDIVELHVNSIVEYINSCKNA